MQEPAIAKKIISNINNLDNKKIEAQWVYNSYVAITLKTNHTNVINITFYKYHKKYHIKDIEFANTAQYPQEATFKLSELVTLLVTLKNVLNAIQDC